MSFKKVVVEGYNHIAIKYLRDRDRFANESELKDFAGLLPESAEILDAGCGPGTPIAKYFADFGHRLTGIDISSKMLDLARANVPGARFLHMNIARPDFDDQSFDAIICAYALFHLPREKHEPVIAQFNRMLKPGGLLLLSTGSEEWEGIEDFYGAVMYWSHYGPARYRDMLANGFEIVFEREVAMGGERHHWFCAGKSIHE